MSVFHDVRLPLALAFGAGGGPELSTEIVRLASGGERRNARWSRARRRWDVGGVLLDAQAALELRTFFEARRGRWAGFRFRDPLDWKSCAPDVVPGSEDQVIGAGDGAKVSFQLGKTYLSGDASWSRAIRRPAADSVIVAVDGVMRDDVSVDHQTGVVTLAFAPGPGAVVTAGFVFDVPVRFDVDQLELVVEGIDAIRLGATPLIELFEGGAP